MAANEPKRECNKPVAKTIYIQVRQLRERGGVGEAGRQTERGKKKLKPYILDFKLSPCSECCILSFG